jgi:ABC-type transport system substrate-binding protein
MGAELPQIRRALQRCARAPRALNYCTNREGLVTLLNGLAEPAAGVYHKTDPYFHHPKEQYTYDPAKAKALLKEAGYGLDKPVTAKVMISTSGSGRCCHCR